MNFSQLNFSKPILDALTSCGYTEPTPIQAEAIPLVLEGKDVIGVAQTGTGKTAAFVLPALETLLKTPRAGKPRVLVLTPTRELAMQINQAIQKYAKFMRVKTVNILGGMPYPQQIRDLSRPFDLLVATPGRLIDHLERDRVDLSGIEMLVLDEADRMLDMGFIDDVHFIAGKLAEQRQTLLFTATFEKRLERIASELMIEPEYVDIAPENITADTIEQRIHIVDSAQHKYQLLQHILDNDNITQAIIFIGTKMGTEDLAEQLQDDGYSACALHGDMRQHKRTKTIAQLRAGKMQILIATDVAARGIDIKNISHVFNYDLPKFAENYVHRIGRTGRAGKTGIAISFVSASERQHLRRIETLTQQPLTAHVIPGLEPRTSLQKPKSNFNDRKKSFRGNGSGRNSSSGRSFSGKKTFGDKKPSSTKSSFGEKRFSSDSRPSSERQTPSSEKRSHFDKNPHSKKRFNDNQRPARSFGGR